MKISTFKIVWKYLTGGFGKVADYLLDVLNEALANLDSSKKESVTATLNLVNRILATIIALKWLCPTKWQIACDATVAAVASVSDALEDLELNSKELAVVRERFAEAVAAWKSPDDEDCVSLEMLED